jgi:hypothetical protein
MLDCEWLGRCVNELGVHDLSGVESCRLIWWGAFGG